VTRPTGRALRLGIESQIGEIGSVCLSVLDFTQVVVLDYSCADEAVAKLIQRYRADDRPADAYFIARGLGEQHCDPIEEVLQRHRLMLVGEVEGEFTLLGAAEERERTVWRELQRAQRADEVALTGAAGLPRAEVTTALDWLAGHRVVLPRGGDGAFRALSTLLP
jgi:hypothetical protein